MNFFNVLITKLLLLFNINSTAEIPVVKNFDINQFTGTWYEVRTLRSLV